MLYALLRKNDQSMLEVTRYCRPSSRTSSMNVKLKRLVNHRKKVSERKLGKTFHKNQRTTRIRGTSTIYFGLI
jgi:hypothetical protein